MIPAFISSVVILFLYLQRRSAEQPHAEQHATMTAVRSELGTLNARLDTLRKRLARQA